MKDFSSELERAWQLRHNRELEACASLLRELAKLKPGAQEIEILQASLLRAEGALEESDVILVRLERTGKDFAGRVELQRGLNFYARGNYAKAWPYFQRAKESLPSEFERMVAVANLLGCRDNLGLCYEAELEQVEAALKRGELQFPELHSQVRFMRQRLHFRRGEISQALLADTGRPSQEQYYGNWIASLPYLNAPRPVIDPGAVPSLFFQFRFHTLIGKTEIEEVEIKSSEMVDRIYLWVWKWMAGDSAYPLEKIASQLHRLRANPTLTTAEDFLLLRNALGWIDLLGRTNVSDSFLPRFSQGIAAGFPLLDHEWKWQKYFLSRRDGGRDSPPNLTFRETCLHELENAARFPVFSRLFSYVRAAGSELPNSLYPETFLAVSVKGERVHSKDCVYLAKITLKNTSVSFADISRELWGIRAYDALVHAGKVHRVIQRLKKYFSVEFVSRDGVLFSEWRNRPKVYESGSMLPSSCAAWLSLADANKAKVSPTRKLAPKLDARPMRREEIEKELKCSKATAARWIKKNVDLGLLRKIGQGKKVHYQWSEK
jgi:tetratricopeptide (TPR) repeat protein